MSSIYNNLLGVNPGAAEMLKLLDTAPSAYGRLRDVWVFTKNLEHPQIVVHARIGGPSRKHFEDVFEWIQKHPWYIRDEDGDYDPTYVNIYFQPPPGTLESVINAIAGRVQSRMREEGKPDALILSVREDIWSHIIDNRSQREKWEYAMGTLPGVPGEETES